MSDIIFRAATQSDLPLVYSAWLKSYAGCRPPCVSLDGYYTGHHDVIERLLDRAPVTVACTDDSRDTIVGFCCHEPHTVHYIYIKNIYRAKYWPREQVALRLMSECIDIASAIMISHKTRAMDKFLSKNKLTAVYNPYLAWTEKDGKKNEGKVNHICR
jgi:hypothetical protein